MRKFSLALLSLIAVVVPTFPTIAGEPETDVSRVLKPGELPPDSRLGSSRVYGDEYHPWTPPTSKAAWKRESERIRRQVLVAVGLWPMPPKRPLEPIIHGKIDRGQYTIEKVYFASHPGHYVTGNLYRPAKIEGRVPGILCPHGHWRNGRFYDSIVFGDGERGPRRQLAKGAEEHMSGARYPVQARMAQLAKMGCVVFHYDMVGYADSGQIAHRTGFTDAEAGLRLQNFMGLQTFNSIRALDFLMSLPEVDPARIGVTGSSGGGTQTFMLGAVDPRPAVAFPAVMVSTGMQGGCVCENAEYLRIGINNIALASLFAPKPMAMSGADDWTIAIETRGYPELKQVYCLYGKCDLVYAKAYPQFGHNYNQVARQMMYDWFNQHLKLGFDGPIHEDDFWPVPPAELSVFDDDHKLPADAKTAAELREYLTSVSREQFAALLPTDAEGLAEYRRVIGGAARVMLNGGAGGPEEIETEAMTSVRLDLGSQGPAVTLEKGLVGRRDAGEAIPFVVLLPEKSNGSVVLWIDGGGKSHLFDQTAHGARPVGLNAAVGKLLAAGTVVASADLFLTGEFVKPGEPPAYPEVNETYQGYTFGYNRPVLSNRVRDILTVVELLRRDHGAGLSESGSMVRLVGTGDAGPWALLAAAVAGEAVSETIADAGGFSFSSVKQTTDPMFLPGALKYGGLGGLAALAAPMPLTVAGLKNVAPEERQPLIQVYNQAQGTLTLSDAPLTAEAVTASLIK